MTSNELLRMIAEGETLAVEFKGEERQPLNDRDHVRAVVCLANCSGHEPAYLLLGVEDDGRVMGARPRHGNGTDRNRLAALIANQTRPPMSVSVESVELDGKTILVIEIPAQQHPVATADGVFCAAR